MAKIKFDIKYRPQIESGEYRVIDKDGHNIRIICWDKKSQKKYGYHIVGLIEFGPNDEESTYYTLDGKGRLADKEPCLFIITPEEELTEWEKAIGLALTDAQLIPRDKDGIANIHDIDEFIKQKAAELLDLARVELVDEQTKREDLSFSRGIRQGREDAKKSPWIPASNPPDDDRLVFICVNDNGIAQCVGCGCYKHGVWVDAEDKLDYPDYWMEIPELPKEE